MSLRLIPIPKATVAKMTLTIPSGCVKLFKITSLLYWGVFAWNIPNRKLSLICDFRMGNTSHPQAHNEGIQISTYVQWLTVHYNIRCPVLVLLQRTNDSLQIYVDFSMWTYYMYVINIWSIGRSTDVNTQPSISRLCITSCRILRVTVAVQAKKGVPLGPELEFREGAHTMVENYDSCGSKSHHAKNNYKEGLLHGEGHHMQVQQNNMYKMCL